MSAWRISQSQQDFFFCVEKAETNILALHQKRCDFPTKAEFSIRRIFGSFSSAMEPGEQFEFFPKVLEI
jgi:hypothetical protein